ncbi:MAG: hypothetical protein WC107_02010 [Patescibacteria group bacterium]
MAKHQEIDANAIELPKVKKDQEIEQRIASICNMLKDLQIPINPFVAEQFSEPDFFNALPGDIRESDNRLAEYMAHTMAFDDYVVSERRKSSQRSAEGLFGDEVFIPKTPAQGGFTRREESGRRINVQAVSEQGQINPEKVLFYRVTQPSGEPKPEYYWTSDLHEVMHGLNAELSREKQETAVILVSDLRTISENGGLIEDVNDDQGLAVRQIGMEPFDQKRCLAIFNREGEE